MHRATIFLGLVLGLTLGVMNLDFSQLLSDTTSVVALGPDNAEARGRSFRSSPRISRPSPRVSRPAPSKPKPKASQSQASKPKAKSSGQQAAAPKANKKDAATQAAKREQSRQANKKPAKLSQQQRTKAYGNRSREQIRQDRQKAQQQYTPAQRTTIVNNYGGYRDSYDPFFMYRVSTLSLAMQHAFYYNHWATMSAARQQALLAQNAGLQAYIAQQQAAGVAANPNYVPTGMDAGLMHDAAYVDAQYGHRSYKGLYIFLGILGAIGLLIVAYRVFLYREQEGTSSTGW